MVSRRVAVGALALATLGGVALGIAAHRLTADGPPAHPAAEVRGQAVWPVGLRRAPGFSLPDQSGKLFSLASLRGRPVILTFMDSQCHQECPLEGHAIAAALRTVPAAEQPVIVVVSVDPWADTRASAHRAMRRFDLARFDWRWLLGSRERLERVWHNFRIEVRRSSTDIEHTDALYLIDARGFERAGMVYPFLPTWISNDLSTLADEG
jgi:protein SCO1/2